MMSDLAISSGHSVSKRLHFWLTFGLVFLSLAAVGQIAQLSVSYKHHDGPFSSPEFGGDFDVKTNQIKVSIRGVSVTFHDTGPYVTRARG
jgi:hypothetical protein